MPPAMRIGALRVARPDLFVRTREVLDAGRTARTETIVAPAITRIPSSRVPIEVEPRDPVTPIRLRVPPIVRRPVLFDRAAIRDLLDLAPKPDGKPRSDVTLPIAPEGGLDDTKRFEDPKDPAVFWYVPRYDVKRRDARFEMSLGPRGNGWALIVKLVPSAAQQVTDAGGGRPLPHDLAVTLRYKRKFAKIETEDTIDFTEVTTETPPEGPIVTAVAALDTIEKRDAAFLALTTPSAAPVLEIVRTVRVAQRVTQRRPLKALIIRGPLIARPRFVELFEHANFQGATHRLRPGRYDVGALGIPNDTLSSLKVPAGWRVTVFSESNFWGDQREFTADTPYVGDELNDRASSIIVEEATGVTIYEHANFQGNSQVLPPGHYDVGALTIGNDTLSSVRVPRGWRALLYPEAGYIGDPKILAEDIAYVGDDFNDRTSSISIEGPRGGGSQPAETEPLYTEGSYALAWRLDPFVIDKDLHPYVYTDVIPSSVPPAEPEPRSVEFDGASHVYYQDPRERHRFYYLPDAFRLMRQPIPPRTPMMVVQLTPGANGADDSTATLKFGAVAFTNNQRLDAAVPKLEQYLPQGETKISLEPLAATNVRFSLALPGGGVQYQPRPDAVVDMVTGTLSDLVNLPFSQFSQVFDAMFSPAAPLFSGFVTLGPSDAPHTVPFSGRLADLHGQVLDTAHAPHAQSGGATLTLTNVIESPVTVGAIAVKLRYGTQDVQGVIADLALPIEVASGASVELLVKPASAPPADVKPEVVLTLDHVKVALDREALLETILVSDVIPKTKFPIKVKAHKVMFDATAADPLLSMIVHFEDGGSVDLTETSLEGTAQVSTPLTALLLDKADARAYRYKLEVIRKSSRKRDADWRSDTVEILYPDPS